MKLWMFPGQPLKLEQPVPDDDLHIVAELCLERCGYDLLNCRPVDGSHLSSHTCLQIHGVAMSLYRARRLQADGNRPDLLAEHSLGIYAALAVSGSIAEGTALELAARFGNSMRRMGQERSYALGCPVGLAVDPVEAAARNNGVYVANYNTSRHFLLAGEQAGVAAALEECRAAGAFSVSMFDCEAPLHTPLMTELAPVLTAIVQEYRFSEPQVPLVESIRQTRLCAAAIPDFLVQELQQPVWWERTWKQLTAEGVTRGIEVGSGQALTKFNRWIDSEADRL